ncbi:MAG: M50 family metallopeptidase [Acidobacteria bacterium]|nr:M50 family metallopeptidase [Acidobacteriota bacterium]
MTGRPLPPGLPLALTLATAAASYVLWDTPVVYPLKIFVVFLHEISHGLAAVATGGTIERIEINANQGGVCWTRGGSRFWTASAGYLGSLLWGALLLVAGARTRLDRPIVACVGLFVLGVTLLYVRTGFGLAYGIGAGAVLLGVATTLPPGVSDALLRILGTVSCLYAPWDVASDVLLRDVPGSDAHALAALTGLPAVAWGTVWIVVAVVVALWALSLTSPRRVP